MSRNALLSSIALPVCFF